MEGSLNPDWGRELREKLKREVIAGITTFLTMSYVLIVNPAILADAGVPKEGVIFATAVSSSLATLVMGVYADLPFALAPGMGLNAYFAYTVCNHMGVSWKTALTAVFVEGVLFLILALFRFREAIFKSIPTPLAYGISAGIGAFISFIGLKNAGIVVGSSDTFVRLGNLKSPAAFITLVSLLLIAVLDKKGITGSLLIGILFAVFASVPFGLVGKPKGIFGLPEPTAAFKLDFSNLFSLSLIPVVLAFLIVDVFDTVGTLSALSVKMGVPLSDEKLGRALTSDAVGTTVGALLGTSTVTTYVESATGVAAGGRTGITAVTVALLFLASLFLYPLISVVPTFATSPALIYVGYLMMEPLKRVNWNEVTDSFPAFVTFLSIPLTFSISDGMGLGFVTYALLKAFLGKLHDLNPVLILISLVFVAKFFL